MDQSVTSMFAPQPPRPCRKASANVSTWGKLIGGTWYPPSHCLKFARTPCRISRTLGSFLGMVKAVAVGDQGTPNTSASPLDSYSTAPVLAIARSMSAAATRTLRDSSVEDSRYS